MTKEEMEWEWRRKAIQEPGHVAGWGDCGCFRGVMRAPHAGEGRKRMARWKRENKAGKYGRAHIRSEMTLNK